MVTTTYHDATFGVREIGGRTDSAGTGVDDLPLEQDALINAILTEGYLTTDAFQVAADSPASMDVIVGSGTAKADLYVVETDETGRHPYIVRLDDANVTVALDAADASNPRIDEIWLVVRDPGLSGDAGSLALPRIAYRKGDADASPAAPGADSAWAASVKLATITVAASASSIAAGDIADNRSAATLVSVLDDALAKLTGATFTGAVTAPQLQQSGAAPAGTDAPSTYANGLTYFPVSSSNGWPDNGEVVTFKLSSDRRGQILLPYRSETTTRAVRFRGLDASDSGWGDWIELARVDNVGEWEVDNATEVASQALTTSFSDVASVTLTIPSDWGSWKCQAYATYVGSRAPGDTSTLDTRIVIDGTSQQTKEIVVVPGTYWDGAVGGRRTGMTTTGSRTVSVQGRETGDNITLSDIYLYARAVRTS